MCCAVLCRLHPRRRHDPRASSHMDGVAQPDEPWGGVAAASRGAAQQVTAACHLRQAAAATRRPKMETAGGRSSATAAAPSGKLSAAARFILAENSYSSDSGGTAVSGQLLSAASDGGCCGGGCIACGHRGLYCCGCSSGSRNCNGLAAGALYNRCDGDGSSSCAARYMGGGRRAGCDDSSCGTGCCDCSSTSGVGAGGGGGGSDAVLPAGDDDGAPGRDVLQDLVGLQVDSNNNNNYNASP